MVRLNEPPAPVETMESLKRKFMRQNRDIARTNSTQSMRIRSLENETSRLLADNLGLREQVLRLQLEIDDGRSRRIADSTSVIKAQLQEKMHEIDALINNLNRVSNTPERRKSSSGKLVRSPNASPQQRRWKFLSEGVAAQEGRLPPILENKSFPRKTLEKQELTALLDEEAANITDSPEIGPPPVSQFVNEDPVKIDLPTRTKLSEKDDSSDIDPPLSVNLEHRKKRKDSIGGAELRRGVRDEPPSMKEATGAFKIGAKRKLSVRDDEEGEPNAWKDESSPEGFQFTRGGSNNTENSTTLKASAAEKNVTKVTSARVVAVSKATLRDKSMVGSTAIAARKVLAPKSVNNSPRKALRPGHDSGKALKAHTIKSKSSRDLPPKEQPQLQEETESKPVIQAIISDVEPEPPASHDLVAPFEAHPSAVRQSSRDTPPPSDLGPGAEAHRPSRRARASVSYAEPSLRDKMRRPTKELVDAVTDSKSHRNSIKAEEGSGFVETRVKCEPELDDDAWKTMPDQTATEVESSAVADKAQTPEPLSSAITTHRRRRESLLNQTENEVHKSSSSDSIATLLASKQKAREEARDRAVEEYCNVPSKKSSDVDIYEFKGSPPRSTEEPVGPHKTDKASSKTARRRTAITREAELYEDNEMSDMEISKRSEGLVSRRRQSSIVPRSSSSASNRSTKQDDDDKSLKKSTSTAAIADVTADGGSRSDRIAARRRSMML